MLNNTDEITQGKSRSWGQWLQTTIERVSIVSGYVPFALIVLMMVFLTFDVVTRWMGTGIPGSVEVTELLLVFVSFFALGYCEVEDRHIRVDVFSRHYSPRARWVLKKIARLIGIVFFGAMLWGSFDFSSVAYKRWEVTQTLALPVFPVKILVTLSLCIFVLQLISTFIHENRQNIKKG